MTHDRSQRWAGYALAGLVLLLIGLMVTAVAKAQTVPRDAAQVSWTNPTTNTDSTAIPATCPSGVTKCGKLALTRVEYGSCSGTAFGTKVGEITVTAPGTSALVSALVPQMYCFRAIARNDFATDSAPSNVATKTIAPPTPNPPQVAVDTVAYEIKTNSTGTLVATRVGLVPLGTVCTDQQQKAGGVTYARVPRDAVDMVNWPANLKLNDVWAKCG